MSAPVRWIVAGCGWVASDFVLPALGEAANAVVVGVVDPDPAAREAARALAPGAWAGARLDGGPATDADALYVAAPNDAHAELVAAAAELRLAVLCEKPLGRDAGEAATMVEACEAAGVPLATAYDQRFHPAHLRLRELVARGDLGLVTAARLTYACWVGPEWAADNWRADAGRAGGGALIDLAPHGLDLLSVLLDDRLDRLVGLDQQAVHPYPVEDGAALVGRFERTGALALLHVAYNTPETFPRRTLELVGTKAMAIATDTMGQTSGGRLERIDAADGARTAVALADEGRSPFLTQVEAFSDALNDDRPFPFPAREDLHVARLMDEVRAGFGAEQHLVGEGVVAR